MRHRTRLPMATLSGVVAMLVATATGMVAADFTVAGMNPFYWTAKRDRTRASRPGSAPEWAYRGAEAYSSTEETRTSELAGS